MATRRALIAAVVLLGAGLRLTGLGAVGLNSDEAVYMGQAAAMAEAPELEDLFPVFRAHPLLSQSILAVLFRFGVSDVLGRWLAALFGVGTILLAYRAGQRLYGWWAGWLAALLLAVMPYHVIVSRQFLLDTPMAFFATLTLSFLADYATGEEPSRLYAAGAGMGLVFLSKETGLVLLAAVYAFLALSPGLRVRFRELGLSLLVFGLVVAPYPLTLSLAGGAGAGRAQQYLIWQLSRRPNHDWTFYPEAVAPSIGLALLAAAALGYFLLRRENSRKEVLLATWVVVPVVFFQLWPVKGFHYLLLVAPPLAIAAARTLTRWPRVASLRLLGREFPATWPRLALATVVAGSLLLASLQFLFAGPSDRFLAGSGGVPGGREAGEWIRHNTPSGATLMTIGPSMANILQFYGHRRALGLSVSPNPLHRNPAYEAIRNPDFDLRTGEIQYVVWDAYSASRSTFFSDRILRYAEKYDGRVVHVETIALRTASGEIASTPVIVVYEVRP
ncbi:MAG TPA: glycosyltransferase family 39 protein [Anaerolineales bacterium]|nr:glycosyltransferase family 39 protein [Anaerolineales bacterium]